MEMDATQKTRLLATAKRLSQSWFQGLTSAETEALGGHSRDALERVLGSAFLDGFRAANMASFTQKMPAPKPAPPNPAQKALTKGYLVKSAKALGAPEGYIVARLGTNRKPKVEEKQQVARELDLIRSGSKWEDIWPTETP
jgi:hypothetical protein